TTVRLSPFRSQVSIEYLGAVAIALASQVGQALSIRRPQYLSQRLIFPDHEDLLRVFSLDTHHPDLANVAHGSCWAECDAGPVRRNPSPHRAFPKLLWRLPQHRDGPQALLAARFDSVGEQVCAVGKPRSDHPVGA